MAPGSFRERRFSLFIPGSASVTTGYRQHRAGDIACLV
jgi:hypothetical protein